MIHRPAEYANGVDHDDPTIELLARVRGIDERLGHSPDPALGLPGSGIAGSVAVLMADRDYRVRRDEEQAERAQRWRDRIHAATALVGGLVLLAGASWAVFRFATLLVKP